MLGSRPRNSTNSSIGSREPPCSRMHVEEFLAGVTVEDAGFLEGRKGIGRQDFGPLVAVVAGCVAAAKDVCEAVFKTVECRRLYHGNLFAHLVQGVVDAAPLSCA